MRIVTSLFLTLRPVTQRSCFSSTVACSSFLPQQQRMATRCYSSSATAADRLMESLVNEEGQDVKLAVASLYEADAVCFDVDSTVIAEEGIDVLADSLGQGPAVAALTKEAMQGGMKFQEALEARLNLLKPSKQDVVACTENHPAAFTEGVQDFVKALQDAKKDVYLVSGGFRLMIEPIAARLDIPITNIVANTLLFDEESGAYTGFDPTEPTSADMGKPRALTKIQDAGDYKCMVMIGDGATDAQAKPPAKAFIGFGGVSVRPAVQQAADWFVYDFKPLTAVVKQLLADQK